MVTLRVSELIEALAALHLTSYVQSDFEERGGFMFVAPPAALKSTLLEIVEKQYHDALLLSDINQKTLVSIRDQIAGGKIRTLIFSEMAKLYERKAESSSGLEGILRAMTGEGFKSAGFEEARIARFTARAMVMGAMVPAFARDNNERWEKSGFGRRFLWGFFQLENPEALNEAVIRWERMPLFVGTLPRPPLGSKIPNLTTADERRAIRLWVKHQPGGDTVIQHQLMVKALAVLRWARQQAGRLDDSFRVLEHFAGCLGKDSALLTLDPPPQLSPQRRAAERRKVDRAAASAAGRHLASRRKERRK